MRIAEYKQIGTKIENGKTIPVMEMTYRDMTEEEMNKFEKLATEISTEEPTQQDRIEAQVMYTALMTDTLLDSEE